jgi:DNA-binding response OmpR family regulator
MRILIAEDDLTSRSVLAAVLRKVGYEVIETHDGVQAWEVLQKSDAPRLVILDWMMPGLDGLDVLRRVRTLPTDQPPYILMLTAKTEKSEIIIGLDAGANDYLTKPFDPGELRARIEVGRRMVEMQETLACKIEELHHAMGEIKTLRGIVPICASCKKIRDDKGFWSQVEVYVRDHSEAEFSHGLCPDCIEVFYAEMARDKDKPR